MYTWVSWNFNWIALPKFVLDLLIDIYKYKEHSAEVKPANKLGSMILIGSTQGLPKK